MNKADLINHLSTQLGGRRAATVAVEALVDAVIREVAAGGSVGITGFGTFERADRAPRTGRNPRTGDLVPIAGTSTPRFRPGTQFKAIVADPALLPAEGLAGGRAPAGSAPAPRAKTTKKARAKTTKKKVAAAPDNSAAPDKKKDSKKKDGKKKAGAKKAGKKK